MVGVDLDRGNRFRLAREAGVGVRVRGRELKAEGIWVVSQAASGDALPWLVHKTLPAALVCAWY